MSERVVEKLEALQAKWRRRARVDCDPANGSATIQAAGQRTAILADELTSLIVAAREQEKELAHWRWLYSDHGEPKKDSKPEQTQHSADLREIAEMAIAKCAALSGKEPSQ